MSEWRPVPGFEGVYAASPSGEVKRVETGHVLKPYKAGEYLRVSLWRANVETQVLVHQLIARTFLGEAPAGHEVNHRNGRKHDNRVNNLEWSTRSENAKHAFILGLKPRPHACLDRETVEEIRAMVDQFPTHSGSRGPTTISALARRFGVSRSTIQNAARGRTYRDIKAVQG